MRRGEVCRCYGKEEGDGGFGNGKVHVDTGAEKKGAVFAILLLMFWVLFGVSFLEISNNDFKMSSYFVGFRRK